MLFSIKFEIWNIYLAVILWIFSIGIITKYAPVENKNKPLEKIEKNLQKKANCYNLWTYVYKFYTYIIKSFVYFLFYQLYIWLKCNYNLVLLFFY